jgi:hypothetical protein
MELSELKQALGRFLGPAGSEIGCDVCFNELDRYVEVEVVGHDADAVVPGLRAHLNGCPACHEEHEGLYALLSGEQPCSASRLRGGRVTDRCHVRLSGLSHDDG